MVSNLRSFIEPKNIAIIGASDHLEKVGGILMKKSIESKMNIIPINVSHNELFGRKCFKSVLEYKGSVDLAVIAIPAEFVFGALEDCGKKKVKNVIIISSGFSEMGNGDVEKLIKISKKYGIKFLGSNCFGVCNPLKNLDLTFASSMPQRGKIAFVSQSGALWSYISEYGDFGFSNFVSLGNMESLDFHDFIDYFAEDKNTKSIVLYIEKLKDGKKFIESCKRAISRGKKIYAVKGGSSAVGGQAAISHTASVASDYEIYRGVFKQAGVVQCDGFLNMFEKAAKKQISLNKKKIDFNRSFIVTNAGGAGVLLSDYLISKGATLIEKPMDILGTARSEDYARVFLEVKKKNFDTLFVVVTPQSMTDSLDIAQKISDLDLELKILGKKVVALFLGGKSVNCAKNLLAKEEVVCVDAIEELG